MSTETAKMMQRRIMVVQCHFALDFEPAGRRVVVSLGSCETSLTTMSLMRARLWEDQFDAAMSRLNHRS